MSVQVIIVTSCKFMNCYNERFCSMVWVWVMGHDAPDIVAHVTLWHNIIASQLPSSLLVILSNNNSINSADNCSNRGEQRDLTRMLCRPMMPRTVRYFSLSKYRMPWQPNYCWNPRSQWFIETFNILYNPEFIGISGSQSIDRLHKRNETMQELIWI